ncbi:MAG TPA: DUF4412 domain-containing protein [Opitutus sp.]|nr:DUF4412 domain-containing protein [Opitutus sp.]
MKSFPLALLAVAALATPAALPAANFEGSVRMKITDPHGAAHEITQHIKDGLVRSDVAMEGRTMSMIMDTRKQEMTILMPEQHMYMVHGIPGAAAGPAAPKDGPPDDATLEKTGDTEKILGYNCTKYVVKEPMHHTTTELWLTDELGNFMGLGSGPGPMGMGRRAGPPRAAWEKALAGKDVFPLRVVTHDASGAEKFRLEATEVKRESQPDSLFTPPADFRKFDMGAMMQGMGGMPRDN